MADGVLDVVGVLTGALVYLALLLAGALLWTAWETLREQAGIPDPSTPLQAALLAAEFVLVAAWSALRNRVRR